jgi:plastocyanin
MKFIQPLSLGLVIAAGAAFATANQPTVAPAAGTVTGTIVFDGKVPEVKPLSIGAKQSNGCCTDPAAMDTTDMTLLIDAKSKGIANVVITLEVKDAKVEIPKESMKLDQKGCRFSPHVLIAPVGATIEYLNSDKVSHNIHTYAVKNSTLNKTVAGGASSKQEVKKAEVIKVTCDLHPWMASYVYVTDATHWALSGADGSFTIEGVPAGKYKLTIWHEKLGKAKADVVVAEDGSSEAVAVKMSNKKKGGSRRRR